LSGTGGGDCYSIPERESAERIALGKRGVTHLERVARAAPFESPVALKCDFIRVDKRQPALVKVRKVVAHLECLSGVCIETDRGRSRRREGRSRVLAPCHGALARLADGAIGQRPESAPGSSRCRSCSSRRAACGAQVAELEPSGVAIAAETIASAFRRGTVAARLGALTSRSGHFLSRRSNCSHSTIKTAILARRLVELSSRAGFRYLARLMSPGGPRLLDTAQSPVDTAKATRSSREKQLFCT